MITKFENKKLQFPDGTIKSIVEHVSQEVDKRVGIYKLSNGDVYQLAHVDIIQMSLHNNVIPDTPICKDDLSMYFKRIFPDGNSWQDT